MMHHNHVEILYCNTFLLRAGISKEAYARLQHELGMRLVGEIFRRAGVMEQVSSHTVQAAEYGKPFVAGCPCFNIAHSDHVVIAAVGHDQNIGIDIELVRSVEWKEYTDVFTKLEMESIRTSLNPSYTLLELWVKKESILKADGHGLQIPFTNVILRDDYGMISGQQKKYFLKPIEIENHICYVSSLTPDNEIKFREFFI